MPKSSTPFSLTQPGSFVTGCNYWASHAGTRMWVDWQPEVVRTDLRRLAAQNIQVMRVFPLWPDFQPIVQLYTSNGQPREIRMAGEVPLPPTPAGQAGLDETMLTRFAEFSDLCAEAGIQLIVGLLTGWMSGRLFVPPALEGRNVITDPICLTWEIRFVREYVTRFRQHPAIYAWDLGNECNVMGKVENPESALVWSSLIANTIRAADPSRPIVSGMHSLSPDEAEGWRIQDQGEACDILTTHPYPYWVRHCRNDAVNSRRTLMHATAETRFYGDIAGKPCIVEEIGTMGPMISDEKAAADFTRVNLFSLWTHDCRSFIWWCASDQTELTHPPYDWTAVERELGLLRMDGSPKPVLQEMARFATLLGQNKIPVLPPRQVDAICILTRNQDQWAAAYAAFVLAKQAGISIEFQYVDQPLKSAPLYLLPSLTSPEAIPHRKWVELLQKVNSGATLYLSLADGILADFASVSGLEIQSRAISPRVRVAFDSSGREYPIHSGDQIGVRALRGETILQEADDNPVCQRADYGKGTIFTLTFPLEVQLTLTPAAFGEQAAPYWRIYAELNPAVRSAHFAHVSNPQIGITEHAIDEKERILVGINYSTEAAHASLELTEGVKVSTIYYGAVSPEGLLVIPPCEAMVCRLVKAT